MLAYFSLYKYLLDIAIIIWAKTNIPKYLNIRLNGNSIQKNIILLFLQL